MSQTQRVIQRIRGLAAQWAEIAQKRRTEADAEADKVWSARQYGLADSFEEAAQQANGLIDGWDEAAGGTVEWPHLVAVWEQLAGEADKLVEANDNRITVGYRQANAEGYQRAAAELREAMRELSGK